MKCSDMDTVRLVHDLFEGKFNQMDLDQQEMRPDDFNHKYGKPNAATGIDVTKASKELKGNPWAPNHEKVFINLTSNQVSGAMGNMALQGQINPAVIVKPLEHGGLGATQTTNTSNKTYWMPMWLFKNHVSNNRIK